MDVGWSWKRGFLWYGDKDMGMDRLDFLRTVYCRILSDVFRGSLFWAKYY